ncbi:AAA family ATPase [Aeromonas veronii]|uniref:AAA family ATPase n=1 Tax=Aeromonas veronii TaxID=654 RepID=UPI00406D3DD9
MLEIKHKLVALLAQLNEGLVDRDEAMKLALLSLLAGENILLVGPPGTAKSLISRQVAKALKDDDKEGASHFEYLLTKFSTPEEIFGPLSISKLKEDRFERNTAGYLPSVQVAFLDEIFKASSSILNALLTILNERIYHNGASVQKVPLRSLIAASNELPTGQEELSALYDRFLLRSFVNYVSEDNLHKLFTVGKGKQLEQLNQLTLGELVELDNKIASVKIPELIQNALLDIFRKHKDLFKEDRREGVSDRRVVKVIRLLKISALTNDRDEIELSDLVLLRHCLWSSQDNIVEVKRLVFDTLKKYSAIIFEVESAGANNINANNTPLVKKHSENIERLPIIGRFKGLKGSGDEHDPILINNLNELLRLRKPEIGLHGYYFKQMAEIDVSTVSSWTAIDFKGHYDGAGFSIIGREKSESLFDTLQSTSSVKHLYLAGFSLANQANSCKISSCVMEQSMILGNANDCDISGCNIKGSLAKKDVRKCNISQCIVSGYSNSPKLANLVYDCKVSDIEFILDFKSRDADGAVAREISNSKITRCFISGKIDHSYDNSYFGRIYGVCFSYVIQDSEIDSCALGYICSTFGNNVPIYGFHGPVYGAAQEMMFSENKFSNNASLDKTALVKRLDDANGKDGQTVSFVNFNQYFFEYTLNWDFDTVWAWDDQNNNPTLQSVGLNAVNKVVNPAVSELDQTGPLLQQINANLWV